MPSKLWSGFSVDAKKVYNEVMKQALPNQWNTIHPKQIILSSDEWETVCHNFSCYAALSVDKKPIEKGTPVYTETKEASTFL